MKSFSNFIINILKILTVCFFLILTLWRFRIHSTKNIFLNATFIDGILYLTFLLLNIFLCIIMYIRYTKKTINTDSFIAYITLNIYTWVENSYANLMKFIANLSFPISEIIAFMTKYYLKIPLIILFLMEYLPRFLLCLSMLVDVFYYAQFYYCYYFLYFFLFTLIFRAILYISIEIDNILLEEVKNSIEIINYEKLFNEVSSHPNVIVNILNYKLSDYNTQFEHIEEALRMYTILLHELKELNTIAENLKNPLTFKIIIRIFYVILWGYIVYFYPIPIISIIFSIITQFFVTYIHFNFTMLTAGIIFLYYYNRQ